MKFTITMTGNGTPLLMHNSRLANPLDPVTQQLKALTSKREKTLDDYLEISRVEFLGGLYYDSDIGPYLPGENIMACLIKAAMRSKKGPKVKEGVLITSDVNPLAYRGSRKPEELFDDKNYVLLKMCGVQKIKVLRCRPMFRNWSCACDGLLDTKCLSADEFEAVAQKAGESIGVGDWRPRYGRFIASVAFDKAKKAA